MRFQEASEFIVAAAMDQRAVCKRRWRRLAASDVKKEITAEIMSEFKVAVSRILSRMPARSC